MLIRYKEQNINLNNVFYPIKKYYEWSKPYTICFVGIALIPEETLDRHWCFETQEERDKVYNLIMNNYFTDIEELTNDNYCDSIPSTIVTDPNFIFEKEANK